MKYCFTLALLGCLLASCDTSTPAPDDCIDPKLARRTTIVTDELNPVCGCDGKTYDNPSYAKRAGVRSYVVGPCQQ
ncbi:kazal domain protein [Hymenobacter gummosus]|uniref:Kazal domain protein n=1 Tax=Hymenobacter gummosus TaxID=1776032 RepID=A0A431TVL4_9BACT|nr:kazal domain protein [Hymenobacter gummosus]RTQ45326.1 kazal domain protein [Hymenobacter gummosus]